MYITSSHYMQIQMNVNPKDFFVEYKNRPELIDGYYLSLTT